MDQNVNMAFPFDSMKILNKYQLTPQQARRLYYKSEKISADKPEAFVDLMSDLLFVEGIHEFVKVQVEHSSSSTYFYQLSYDSDSSLVKFGEAAQISGYDFKHVFSKLNFGLNFFWL